MIGKPHNNFIIGKDFTVEKTHDIFKEVIFKYDSETWKGVLPKYLEKQGIELSDNQITENILGYYEALNPKNRIAWIIESDKKWVITNGGNQTYKVLKALYSCKWECRAHGPLQKANPQPAARLKALKTFGYLIGSKRKNCEECGHKTMHDILVMLPMGEARFENGNEMRTPMSDTLKERIKSTLGFQEACFAVQRPSKELIIDHKFPSQRWMSPEFENPNDMPEQDIRNKFQLLSNQTNLWKSRFCDRCVKTAQRGDFMGITWYFEGNEKWTKVAKNDESGCVGCPWYDLVKWKAELIKAVLTPQTKN